MVPKQIYLWCLNKFIFAPRGCPKQGLACIYKQILAEGGLGRPPYTSISSPLIGESSSNLDDMAALQQNGA